MSEAMWIAVISGLGVAVVGAIGTILAAKIQAARRNDDSEPATATLVPDDLVDQEELRILRALYGEQRGRWLEAYRGQFYHPFLEKVKKRGWVQQIDKRYFLTALGTDICRRHLAQLKDWRPPG